MKRKYDDENYYLNDSGSGWTKENFVRFTEWMEKEWRRRKILSSSPLHALWSEWKFFSSLFKEKKILYAFFPLHLLQFSRLRFHLLMGKITFVLRTELIFIFFFSFVILRMLKVIYSFLFPKQNFLLIQMSYVDRNKDWNIHFLQLLKIVWYFAEDNFTITQLFIMSFSVCNLYSYFILQ